MGAPKDESPLDPDESPQARVRIERAFWLAKCEVTNGQYRRFKPAHNSRTIDTYWKDRTGPGPSANDDLQPVIRISWHEAMQFCQWLSGKAGAPCRLPTESEWEYACRAGAATPFSCPADQLSKHANIADKSLASIKPWAVLDDKQSDAASISAQVGKYQPNAWGLHDMHGNVFEWCLSVYKPYPFRADDGRDGPAASGPRVIRGGSWDDLPRRCRSAFRLSYPPDYRVYNVGFRVACPAP